MACQINLGGVVTDVATIKSCLFSSDEQKGHDSWLQLCVISLSPTGDVVVFANENRLVILSADWNLNTSLLNYHIASSDLLGEDNITAVLCLPIVTHNNTSQIDAEWTCIAVGFQTGYVKFYTEDCKLLLSEQFYVESVCSIKCQSQHSPHPELNPELRVEEIYIQYQSNICVLSGNHLFNILRNRRSQLLRGDLDVDLNQSSLIAPKKWGFADQFAVNDSAVVGLELSNTFDHLLTASTCGGFDTKYRTIAPNNSLVLGVGNKPFVGFHFAIEGGTQPMLTDMAKAIATKVKSALPAWLTGGKSQPEKQPTAASQPAEPMACRFGVCDLRRNGTNVILSHNKRLAAVTDVLGRICVLDVRQGTVIRMLKGYREAQCAFLQVPDERKSRNKTKIRIATFLIVYCPKKGCLEIITVQQGVKIAVFTASKHSRLLYITHGLMGFTTVSKSKYVCRFSCALLDPDGKLKDITIPFYFALPEKNSNRARDMHLYKKLKHFIKTVEFDEEQLQAECFHTCKELKTVPIQLQCLEMMSACKEVNSQIITQCSDYFLEKYKATTSDDSEVEQKNLKKFAENFRAVARFYQYVTKTREVIGDKDENGNGNSGGSSSKIIGVKKKNKKVDGNLSDLLIGTKEMDSLQKLLDLSTAVDTQEKPARVTFSLVKQFCFSHFVSIFELYNQNQVFVKDKVDDSVYFQVSKSIFENFIQGKRDDLEDFKLNVINSNVCVNDFIKLLITYWVNRQLTMGINLENEIHNLNKVVYSLVKMVDASDDVVVDYNQISKFWTKIRETLANSEKPFPALTAALICKNVSLAIEHERDVQKSGASAEDENIEIWEKLSQENCEWMLIIGKLEDVSLLNIVLSKNPTVHDKTYFSLPKLKQENLHVSLKLILEKGKGAVSELVAQWLTTTGIDPSKLIEKKIDNTTEETPGEKHKEEDENEPLLISLNSIRNQFPYSTEESVLLTNMCWEYALSWQKNIHDFSLLEASLKCLNLIGNVHLKQGLYNLVWNTHLKIIFESACKLVNKVGRMPKEKLCHQDTGLSDKQMLLFMEICTEFLDNLLEIGQQCYNSERIMLSYESIWDESNSGQSLGELALNQTHINYDLVHLHYQLSFVILMQMTFNVKHQKTVTSLFDNAMFSLFFTDFQHKVQISWHKSETKILASRTQFLLKVITASVETLTPSNDGGVVRSESHAKWIGRILNLGRVWNLDVDLLKRFQIIQLYINGYDSVAEELIPAVNELDKLGPDLIGIGGKRLAHYLSSSEGLTEKITTLSPTVKQYLETLNGSWCAPSSLEAITNIIAHSLQYMQEDQKEYKMAVQLFEACYTLKEIQR